MKRMTPLVLLALFATSQVYGQDPPRGNLPAAPSERHKAAARNLAKLLPSEHLTRQAFDQETARRWRVIFLKDLDAYKIILDQKDVDAFAQRDKEIAAGLQSGDLQFVLDIYRLFLERFEQRVTLADEVLKEKLDFSVEESIVLDHAKAQYAENPQQARDAWRRRVKYDLLALKAGGMKDAEALEVLRKRYAAWRDTHRALDEDALMTIAFTALAQAHDSRSGYVSAKAWEETQNNFRNEFEGIGVSIRIIDGECVVTRLIPDGPAMKDGRIKVGDRIVGVADASGKLQDIANYKLSAIVDLIRGPRGSKVRLEVMPAGQTERLLYTFPRDRVANVTARATLLEAGKKADGAAAKVGYIFLPSLYGEVVTDGKVGRSSTGDVRGFLQNANDGLIAKGAELVVLDLRTNNGGTLREALGVCDLFLDGGPIMQIKNKSGKVEKYDVDNKGAAWKGPLVVLTSSQTGAGAEIIAGALQSHGRALIIGEPTSGNGTVQRFFDIESMAPLGKTTGKLGLARITVQQFYRPNGETNQKRGVLPDVELPWLTGVAETDEFAIDFDRIDALLVIRAPFGIDEKMRKTLRAASAGRRAESDDFKKLSQALEIAAKRKERGAIPLEANRYLAERRLLGNDSARIQQVEDTLPVLRDFYMNEALAISADFLGLATKKSE
jgi:carboxyl-terminal processing protease